MIDIEKEPLLTLAQAAKLVPTGRGRTKTTSGQALWRWARFGKGGVTLEHVRRPSGEMLTSAAAVGRFLTALAGPRPQKEIEASIEQRGAAAMAALRAEGVRV